MTDQELTRLYRSDESDRVERKASLSNRGSISKAVCAFATDLPAYGEPGVIFVGVNDDGTCNEAFEPDDETLLLLGRIKSDGNVLPLPSMTVRAVTIDGCDVAVAIRRLSRPRRTHWMSLDRALVQCQVLNAEWLIPG